MSALVDGALEGEERARIEAHVAECDTCRAQAAEERALRTRLAALPAPTPPPGLERRVRARLRRRGRWPVAMRAVLPIAAVLMLALWARGYAPFVAWELSRDHDHCYGRARLPAQVWTSEPALADEWFGERGSWLPLLPPTAGELALLGGRHCRLADVSRAPHLYYASEEAQLSVFVVPHGVRMGDDFATTSKGNAVVLLRLGTRVVGVVGEDHGDVSAFATRLRTSVALLGPGGAVSPPAPLSAS